MRRSLTYSVKKRKIEERKCLLLEIKILAFMAAVGIFSKGGSNQNFCIKAYF
jgi:hypothetical protein